MLNSIKNIIPNWKLEIASNFFKWNLLYIVFLGIIIIGFMPTFMAYIQTVEGREINDWGFLLLPSPINFSVPLFVLIYGSIISVLVFNLSKPKIIIKYAKVWGSIQLLRMLTIYLFPLEAPADMISLTDPIVDGFLSSKEVVITKDLFFSGHTSASFLAVLFFKNRWIKIIAAMVCASIALMIVWQHVHYTIDVLAAPFFAYGVYYLVHKFDSLFLIKNNV